MFVNRYTNGKDEKIRIREKDISCIDYYGNPVVIIEKRRWMRKNAEYLARIDM